MEATGLISAIGENIWIDLINLLQNRWSILMVVRGNKYMCSYWIKIVVNELSDKMPFIIQISNGVAAVWHDCLSHGFAEAAHKL